MIFFVLFFSALLSGPPNEIIKSGKWAKVPILGGYNFNDGSIFAPGKLITIKVDKFFLKKM